MALKGTQSKETITKIILESFKGSFVKDKKIYIPMKEDGQDVQVALTLTCPKNPVSIEESAAAFDWSSSTPEKKNIDLTPAEKEKVEELIKKLNL